MNLDLPPLQAACLGWPLVDELFDDIAALAAHVQVRLKLAAERHAEPGATDLATARRALRDGTAAGAQIRYVHAGKAWCDTLVREAHGLRLVRIAVPQGGNP
jgi:hypothetical protein